MAERQDGEEPPDQYEERIARRMWNAEHVCRRDVLAGIPHRRRGSERGEIDREDDERCDRSGKIGWTIVGIGALLRHMLGVGNAQPPARSPDRISSARWTARHPEATRARALPAFATLVPEQSRAREHHRDVALVRCGYHL